IASMAVGGLLWDVVLLPHMVATNQGMGTLASTFVIVFVLSGVLGALGRLLQTAKVCMQALWLLFIALALSLAADVMLVLWSDPETGVVAEMMFLATYVALGLLALDPSRTELVRPGPTPRDALTGRRLAVLGA